MKAAFHESQGGLDVLRIGDVPDPACGPDDVLVRVRATSLDRVDVYWREGSHGMRVDGPHVGGRDVAGVVQEIGTGAARRHPWLEPGTQVVGLVHQAAHAELAAVPASWIFPLPSGATFEEAAAVPTAGRSAYDALVERARITPGERVLVIAAGSGVGGFGVQLARAAGCRVLATVGAAWKQGPARELGAEAVFDHYEPRLAKRVVDHTGGGVDVVLDHVGAPVFAECLDALRPFGRYVTTGVTAGHRAQLHLGRVFERGLSILGVGRPDVEHVRRVMERLLALVAEGAVRPIVHAVLPLDRIAEGHALLESSSFFGKVVLVP